jgi:hypothetical protein
MHYSVNPEDFRVDIFKRTGKWYTTIKIKMEKYNKETLIHDSFKEALYKSIGEGYKGMIAVCIEPCHECAHPLMITIGE